MKTLLISNSIVFKDRRYDMTIKGSGREEVIEKALQEYRKNLESSSFLVEITPDIKLPEEVSARIPREIPDGFSLVIFECCSHNDGCPYDWRFVIVPSGSIIPDLEDRLPQYRKDRRIEKEIEIISFNDSNSLYYYKLPRGSFGLDETSGEWLPLDKVIYDY